MRRYKGTFDIIFGVEHRTRKEEMEEQFNKEAKRNAGEGDGETLGRMQRCAGKIPFTAATATAAASRRWFEETILKIISQGKDPSTSPLWDQGDRKQV